MTGISSANQQAQVQAQIATAVARESLDSAKQQGKALISLLGQARELQAQTQVHAPGKGDQLDVQA